jgi:hypothetical protein
MELCKFTVNFGSAMGMSNDLTVPQCKEVCLWSFVIFYVSKKSVNYELQQSKPDVSRENIASIFMIRKI